jgi:DnaK suppressor protein
MAKAKKSKSAKRSAAPAKRTKTPTKKSPPRKAAVSARKEPARNKTSSVKPARKPTAAPAEKSGKTAHIKEKKAAAKKAVTSTPRSTSGSKIALPKVIAKKISAPVAKAPAIATQPIQRNSIMSTTPKTTIKKEVAPGGGIVQPATRTVPEMRLRADDAEILASAKERYGRKDLEAFRKLIIEQVQEAREEFEILSQNILDTSGEFEADNQTYSLHTAEQGTDAIEREKTFLHAQRTSDYIKKLDEAIERIDRGTYGICVVCGGLIEKERLQAVPITQKHVDCKNQTQTRKPGSGNSGFRDEEPPPHVE